MAAASYPAISDTTTGRMSAAEHTMKTTNDHHNPYFYGLLALPLLLILVPPLVLG